MEDGGSLVTVDVHDGDATSVSEMLRNMGAKTVDIHSDTGWID